MALRVYPHRLRPNINQTTAVGFWATFVVGWLGWIAWGITTQAQYRSIWVCEIPLGLVALLPPLFAAFQRRFDLLAGPVVFGMYLFFQEGIWTAYMLTTGLPHMHSTIATYLPTLPRVLLYAALALAVFQLPWLFSPPLAPAPPRSWSLPRLRRIALLLPICALVAFIVFLYRVGGVFSYLSQLGSNRVVELVGLWGYVMFAQGAIALGSACAVILGHQADARNWRIYALASALAGILLGLLAGYRLLSLIPLLVVLAAYNYSVGRIQIRVRFLAAMVLVLTFSSIYSTDRDRPELARTSLAQQMTSSLSDPAGYAKALDAGLTRMQGSETFAVVLADTARTGGFQYGWRAVLQAPAMLIPRFIWPDSPFKENPESNRFGTLFFGAAWGTLYQLGGISPTWLAEVYWNFGLAGMLLATLALGYLSRRIYISGQRSPRGLLLLTYWPLVLVLLAEAPSNALTGVLVVLLPMLLLRNYLCPRTRRAEIPGEIAAGVAPRFCLAGPGPGRGAVTF